MERKFGALVDKNGGQKEIQPGGRKTKKKKHANKCCGQGQSDAYQCRPEATTVEGGGLVDACGKRGGEIQVGQQGARLWGGYPRTSSSIGRATDS